MRIRRYNLLPDCLRAPSDEQEPARDPVDNLLECVDAYNLATHRISPDYAVHAHMAIRPSENLRFGDARQSGEFPVKGRLYRIGSPPHPLRRISPMLTTTAGLRVPGAP